MNKGFIKKSDTKWKTFLRPLVSFSSLYWASWCYLFSLNETWHLFSGLVIKTFCSYQQCWHQSIATNRCSQHQKQFASILLPSFNSEMGLMVQLNCQTFQWNNHKPAGSCNSVISQIRSIVMLYKYLLYI